MDPMTWIVGAIIVVMLLIAMVIVGAELKPFTRIRKGWVRQKDLAEMIDEWLGTRSYQAQYRGDGIEFEVTERLRDDARSAFQEGTEPWDYRWLKENKFRT